MRTNNNLVDFASISTYVGSESLVQEAKSKHSDIYLNFAYTDYGENAFIFGEPAKELYNLMKVDNVLGFDDLEDYYTEMEYNMITEEVMICLILCANG